MTGTVCQGCKLIAEIVHTDSLGLDYCARCAKDIPTSSEQLALEYLLANPAFLEGDRVECRTAGEIYDGIGTVMEMSFDIKHGGTLIYPAFRVVIDEPANEHSPEQGWFTEVCLKKVSNP